MRLFAARHPPAATPGAPTCRAALEDAGYCRACGDRADESWRCFAGTDLLLPWAVGRQSRPRQDLRCLGMAEIVLRVRLISGDQLDVWYEHDALDENEVIQRVVETLAEDSGVLRTSHGDRLMVLYGRGVAAVEVAPRGAIL